MAREEDEREDLLKEATALVSRAELSLDGFDESIVAGFRRDGSATVFFGQNAVYQFNSANQLRRVFLDGRLYKAERRRLIQLRRHRTDAAVELVRHDLSSDESLQLLIEARQRLRQLADALAADNFKLVGEVSSSDNFIEQFADWLKKLPAALEVAYGPGLR